MRPARTRPLRHDRLTRIGAALLAVALLPAAGCRKPAPQQADVTTITIWSHQGQPRENAAMRAIIAAFNEAHRAGGLGAEITFFPDRDYADRVSIAAAGRTLPDVLDIDGPYVGPWAAEGLLRPLDDLVPDELRADLLGSLIQQGTYRGKLYALGAFESALVVYYNREIIEKAGLHPPQRPEDAWDFETFVAALRKVRPYCRIPLSLHADDASDEWFTYAFSPLIWSAGGRLIDPDAGRCVGVLDSPTNVAAITRWQRLFSENLAEASPTHPDPFSAGLAAFDWTGHWMLPKFEATQGLRFGVMPLPRMGERFVCPSGSWCWGISRDSRRPELAFKLIAWLLDPRRGIRPIVQANGAVPGRRSAFELFPEYQDMPRRLFREQLERYAHPRPRTAAYLTLTTEFARALRDIALGADVRSRLHTAAVRVQQVLDRERP